MFDYSSHACLPNFVNVARPNMYRAGTVRMDHSGTQTYKAKGSRVANHAWTPTMSVTFYKASVIGKSKKQLESCRTLGTPWQPPIQLLTLAHSQHNKALFFIGQKFLSLLPLKFALFFLSHFIGFTVYRPRQAEHVHIHLEDQSTYNQRHHLQLRKSHCSASTVKNTVERNCNSKNQTESNSCR